MNLERKNKLWEVANNLVSSGKPISNVGLPYTEEEFAYLDASHKLILTGEGVDNPLFKEQLEVAEEMVAKLEKPEEEEEEETKEEEE